MFVQNQYLSVQSMFGCIHICNNHYTNVHKLMHEKYSWKSINPPGKPQKLQLKANKANKPTKSSAACSSMLLLSTNKSNIFLLFRSQQ